MPIQIYCKKCDRQFYVNNDLGGKKIQCPQCKDLVIQVPQVSSETAMNQWLLRHSNGQIYGPIGKEELDRWVSEGRVTNDSAIQPPGQEQWLSAASLYPSLAGNFVHAQGANPFDSPSMPSTMQGYPASALSHRSKIVAGILGLFLGGWGVHRFYLGFVGIGITQIMVTILTCGLGAVWGLIEGILYLVGAMNCDAEGRILRD
ncbi:MAG TPA: NINE protein [Pirellulaceae bacterium]|nr:NINE protein [Pirellulaceae bacterium]HMO92947.1 NINE protein [Pirellulaceae bacterium]HMP68488.1 NINE protein [Pirellulaceae bacterium]